MGLFIAVHVGAGVHAPGLHAAYKTGAAPASTALTPLSTPALFHLLGCTPKLYLRNTVTCRGIQLHPGLLVK